ncbi:hypothetical protein ISR92_01045 [Patescibacteria group bacterium]|nr:hypothetical protein [Patescibacteria group bacterium]
MKDNNLQENRKIEQSVMKRSGQLIGIHAHRIVIKPAQMRYARLYHQRSMSLVSDLLIIIGIMMLFVALIFFWNHPITSNRYIDLEMSINSEQVSGQDVSYVIYWENDNRNTIEDAYMSLVPPRGFDFKEVITNGFEYSEKDNIITLGNLLPGSNGEFTINGLMWADTKLGADWEIRMYYKNLGLRHNKTISRNIEYIGSLLSSNISVPEKVYLNNRLPIKLTVTNNSSDNLSDVKLAVQFPVDFEYLQYTYNFKDHEWNIGSLNANETKELELIGRLTYLAAAQAKFGIATNIIINDESLRQDWRIAEADYILPKVDLDLSITAQDQYILGNEYQAQIYYYNYEEVDLNDVQVKFYSSGVGLETEFTPSQYYSKTVEVQAEDFFNPKFIIKRISGDTGTEMSIWAELSWLDNKGDGTNRIYVFSEKKQLTVTPHLDISARLYYFTPSGDQIGYGPLPPEVGESTSYWVSIRLWPSFGGVENLILKAQLGNNVKLIDYNSSLGNVINGDGISWEVDEYDTSWYYQPQPRLNLQFEIIPDNSQVGKTVSLLRNITANAKSLVNDNIIYQEIIELDNNMLLDNFWSNDGRVIND